MKNVFYWLDNNKSKQGKLLNQLVPIGISSILFVLAVLSARFYITDLINPTLNEEVVLKPRLLDILVGFFLYFVTAIDYALVVGRMLVTNQGSKARVIMNSFTVIGGYVGVTLVLFLWGFSKEIIVLVVRILIFAGSVMIKLASEGTDYFEHSQIIPQWVSSSTIFVVNILHYLTRVFTFWMPEISRPSIEPMKPGALMRWSFILPFVIGLDDMVGYLGAMTIYNVYGLLIGIFFADVFIDVIIFISPELTKKVVQSSILSLFATYAFLYLGFKSYHEVLLILQEKMYISNQSIFIDFMLFLLLVIIADLLIAILQNRKSYIQNVIRGTLSKEVSK